MPDTDKQSKNSMAPAAPANRAELESIVAAMDPQTRRSIIAAAMGKPAEEAYKYHDRGTDQPPHFTSVLGSDHINLYVKAALSSHYQPETLFVPNYVVVGDRNPPQVGPNGQLQLPDYPYKVENIQIPTKQYYVSQQGLEAGVESHLIPQLELGAYGRLEQLQAPEAVGFFRNIGNYFNGIVNTPAVSETKVTGGVKAEADASVFYTKGSVEAYNFHGSYGNHSGISTSIGAGLAFPKESVRELSPTTFKIGAEYQTNLGSNGNGFSASTIRFGNSDAVPTTTRQGLEAQINQNALETVKKYSNNGLINIPAGSIIPVDVAVEGHSLGSLIAPNFKLSAEATHHGKTDVTLGLDMIYRGDVKQPASPGANGLPVTAVNTMNGRAYGQISLKVGF